jgi:hypothetical protein
MKKVTIGAKPQSAKRPPSSDDWVTKRELSDDVETKRPTDDGETKRPTDDGETKRLTIDVPTPLHKRIKSQCAIRGVQMAKVLRDLLEKEFPEEYQERDGTRAAVSANPEIR